MPQFAHTHFSLHYGTMSSGEDFHCRQKALKQAVAMGSKGIGRSGNPCDGQPIVIPAHRRA